MMKMMEKEPFFFFLLVSCTNFPLQREVAKVTGVFLIHRKLKQENTQEIEAQ